MKLINLTPHVLNVWDRNGTEHVIAPYTNKNGERLELRASTYKEPIEIPDFPNFNVAEVSFGEPVLTWESPTGTSREASFSELPSSSEATPIVSKLALASLKEHGMDDRLYLTPGELLRNEAGQSVGCRGFEI